MQQVEFKKSACICLWVALQSPPNKEKEDFIMNNAKRRDNKGRVLRTGEQQRADGRYMFICNNPITGKQIKPVYSWKLGKTDRVPSGKKDSLSLREKEEQIR